MFSTRLNTIRTQGPNPSVVDRAQQTPSTVGKHWTRYIFFHAINLTISCFPIRIKISLIMYSGEFGSVHKAHLIK